ncbi:MAG: hypothetical protein LWX08_14830 [Deltaproteobacteria bacterium]|jgi:hypothetical protein|nr:hypothetical protein [Deltaproteobacteria bacterium]
MIEDQPQDEDQIKKNNISKEPPLTLAPSLQVLLHQYDTLVGIHKHHLDLVLKVNIFIYAITGAILSFYFSKPQTGIIAYSLIFPAFVNLCYGIFFFYASKRIDIFTTDIQAIAKALKIISYPDINFLKHSLQISAFLYFIISIGLSCITLFN